MKKIVNLFLFVLTSSSLILIHPEVALSFRSEGQLLSSFMAMPSFLDQILWLSPLFALLGLTLLFASVRNSRPMMAAFWVTLIMCAPFRLWLQWLADSPYLEPLADTAAMAVAFLLAASIGVWRYFFKYLDLSLWKQRLLAAISWSIFELSRQYWFCGFPWYPLGICWLEVLPSIYGWLGPMGSSLPLVWLALEIVYGRNLKSRLGAGLGFVCFLSLVHGVSFPIERTIDLQAVVIHSELPLHHFHITYSSEEIAYHLRQKLPKMENRKGAYRFLVTSEGLFPDSGSYFQLLEQGSVRELGPSELARHFQGYLMMAIEDDWSDRDRVTNSLWAFSKEGILVNRYAKCKLIPFAEYFPLASVPFLGPSLRSLAREYGILDALDKGIGEGLLELPDLKVALSICFEETFPSPLFDKRSNGAQLWISSSNDGWYPQSRLGSEHALHARMLAATVGMPLLRSTQMGVSGLIDATGAWVVKREGPQKEMISWLPIDLAVDVLSTPFNRIGDKPFLLVWIVLLASMVLKKRRDKGASYRIR